MEISHSSKQQGWLYRHISVKQGDALLFAAGRILMNKSKPLSCLVRHLVIKEDWQFLCAKAYIQLYGKQQICYHAVWGDRDQAPSLYFGWEYAAFSQALIQERPHKRCISLLSHQRPTCFKLVKNNSFVFSDDFSYHWIIMVFMPYLLRHLDSISGDIL